MTTCRRPVLVVRTFVEIMVRTGLSRGVVLVFAVLVPFGFPTRHDAFVVVILVAGAALKLGTAFEARAAMVMLKARTTGTAMAVPFPFIRSLVPVVVIIIAAPVADRDAAEKDHYHYCCARGNPDAFLAGIPAATAGSGLIRDHSHSWLFDWPRCRLFLRRSDLFLRHYLGGFILSGLFGVRSAGV